MRDQSELLRTGATANPTRRPKTARRSSAPSSAACAGAGRHLRRPPARIGEGRTKRRATYGCERGSTFRPRRHTHSSRWLKRHKGGSHQEIACVLQDSIEQRVDAFMAPIDGHQRRRALKPHFPHALQDGWSHECDSVIHLLVRDLQAIGVDDPFQRETPQTGADLTPRPSCAPPENQCARRKQDVRYRPTYAKPIIATPMRMVR
jgi:hypothetical protein